MKSYREHSYAKNISLPADEIDAFVTRVHQVVYGIRKERENPLTTKQVLAHFPDSQSHDVGHALTLLSTWGKIRMCAKNLGSFRHPKGAYVWEASVPPTKC